MESGVWKMGVKFQCHPLTLDRWRDLEALFGPRGACGGCWCMYWRLTHAAFETKKGAGNKRAFKSVVRSDERPGLIAYDGDEPIGWIALAPRDAYPRLARSRVLKPVDDQPVWSVTCFFVAKEYRRSGVSARLLKAAVRYAKACGAKIIEGYPVEPKKNTPDPFAYVGLASTFRSAGFDEVARRSPTRPIMRREIGRRRRG